MDTELSRAVLPGCLLVNVEIPVAVHDTESAAGLLVSCGFMEIKRDLDRDTPRSIVLTHPKSSGCSIQLYRDSEIPAKYLGTVKLVVGAFVEFSNRLEKNKTLKKVGCSFNGDGQFVTFLHRLSGLRLHLIPEPSPQAGTLLGLPFKFPV